MTTKKVAPKRSANLSPTQLDDVQTAQERGRYALNAIRVDPKGVVRTDGRALHFIPYRDPKDAPEQGFNLSTAFAKKLKKLMKSRKLTPNERAKLRNDDPNFDRTHSEPTAWLHPGATPDGEGGDVEAKLTGVELDERVQLVGPEAVGVGPYPDWEAVLPSDSDRVTVYFDPEYMIKALKMLLDVRKERGTPYEQTVGLSVMVNPKLPPEAVVVWNKQGAAALVMPIDAPKAEEKFPACPLLVPAKKK